MTKAVLTSSPSSIYDDQPEVRYHFPATYLNQVRAAIGDLILYYEPRRNGSSADGRQSYFAVARIVGVRPDERNAGHYYADVDNYLDFDTIVPFRTANSEYYESILQRTDGKTNRGAFGRAVRSIPDQEFDAIFRAGFARDLAPWEVTDRSKPAGVAEDPPEYVERHSVSQLLRRTFRDSAFSRHVRAAYNNTCAVTGLKLINGGGRPEVQAAHIRPVEQNGPDSVRNGIALTGTVHWLFDRGLISFEDDMKLLLSPLGVPEDLGKLLRADGYARLPNDDVLRPHPKFLGWHRQHCFKIRP